MWVHSACLTVTRQPSLSTCEVSAGFWVRTGSGALFFKVLGHLAACPPVFLTWVTGAPQKRGLWGRGQGVTPERASGVVCVSSGMNLNPLAQPLPRRPFSGLGFKS